MEPETEDRLEIIGCLFIFGIIGLVIYVIAHFISKWW